MNIVTRTGTFRCKASDHGVGISPGEKKVPQFMVVCQLTEYWDDETDPENPQWVDYTGEAESLTGYLTLVSSAKKKMKNHEQVMKIFNWDGISFTELGQMDIGDVEFQVRIADNDPEYADKRPYDVAWIDEYDATPGGSLNKLDEKGLKDLDKLWGPTMKKGAKTVAKSAPAKNPKDKDVPVEESDDTPAKGSAADKMARNNKQKAIDDKKKAKREAAVAKQKEADAKPAARSMPAMGKVDDDDTPVVVECTKEEAWARICTAQEELGIKDDDKVTTLLMESIKEVGGDDADVDTFDDAQWGTVTESTLKAMVGV